MHRPASTAVTQCAQGSGGSAITAARDDDTPWGESGEYPRYWGARGEDRAHNTARPCKTLKDSSLQVSYGSNRITAGQRPWVDNFTT